MWTETLDKTLKTMKENVQKLSENYWGNYEFTKNLVIYINAPLVLISAFNAYAILELEPTYGRPIHIATAATSIATALLLSGEMIVASKNKVTDSLNKVKTLEHLNERISNLLAQDAEKRTIDSNEFMAAVLEDYKKITEVDGTIKEYGGNLKSSISDAVEDMQSFLEDHWNILYRPNFQKIKLKNAKVSKMIEATGKTMEDIKNMVLKPLSLSKEVEKEDGDDDDDEEKKPSFNLADIYTKMPSVPSVKMPTIFKKDEDSDSDH